MKKLFYSLLIIPAFSLASPEISVEHNDKEGKDTVSIHYQDSDKWNKNLVMTPKINMLFLGRKSQERKHLNCYESFSFLVDKKGLTVDSVEFSNRGSRMYVEDILNLDDETLNKAINEPKNYQESFSLILTTKNLKSIANASEIAVKVCDEIEDFTAEELSAFKQSISERVGAKK